MSRREDARERAEGRQDYYVTREPRFEALGPLSKDRAEHVTDRLVAEGHTPLLLKVIEDYLEGP